jgi:hypothetical protein
MTVGGVMSGVFSTGKTGMAIRPIIMTAIAITLANIGRFMKNELSIFFPFTVRFCF